MPGLRLDLLHRTTVTLPGSADHVANVARGLAHGVRDTVRPGRGHDVSVVQVAGAPVGVATQPALERQDVTGLRRHGDRDGVAGLRERTGRRAGRDVLHLELIEGHARRRGVELERPGAGDPTGRAVLVDQPVAVVVTGIRDLGRARVVGTASIVAVLRVRQVAYRLRDGRRPSVRITVAVDVRIAVPGGRRGLGTAVGRGRVAVVVDPVAGDLGLARVHRRVRVPAVVAGRRVALGPRGGGLGVTSVTAGGTETVVVRVQVPDGAAGGRGQTLVRPVVTVVIDVVVDLGGARTNGRVGVPAVAVVPRVARGRLDGHHGVQHLALALGLAAGIAASHHPSVVRALEAHERVRDTELERGVLVPVPVVVEVLVDLELPDGERVRLHGRIDAQHVAEVGELELALASVARAVLVRERDGLDAVQLPQRADHVA